MPRRGRVRSRSARAGSCSARRSAPGAGAGPRTPRRASHRSAGAGRSPPAVRSRWSRSVGLSRRPHPCGPSSTRSMSTCSEPSAMDDRDEQLPAHPPAKETVPASGARIGVVGGTAMSIPRWPAPNGVSGGSNPRITGPCTGQAHVPTCGAGTKPRRSVPELIGDGPTGGRGQTREGRHQQRKTNTPNATRSSDRRPRDDPRRSVRREP